MELTEFEILSLGFGFGFARKSAAKQNTAQWRRTTIDERRTTNDVDDVDDERRTTTRAATHYLREKGAISSTRNSPSLGGRVRKHKREPRQSVDNSSKWHAIALSAERTRKQKTRGNIYLCAHTHCLLRQAESTCMGVVPRADVVTGCSACAVGPRGPTRRSYGHRGSRHGTELA